jgi:hypothetical protein
MQWLSETTDLLIQKILSLCQRLKSIVTSTAMRLQLSGRSYTMNNNSEEIDYRKIRKEEQEQHEIYESKHYGVVTHTRESSEPRYKVVAVPIELEVSGELDSFVKHEILDEYGMTYPKWIQLCYLKRMQQILSDPTEFGKVVLERKKSDHCIQNADDIEDC